MNCVQVNCELKLMCSIWFNKVMDALNNLQNKNCGDEDLCILYIEKGMKKVKYLFNITKVTK